MVEDYLFIDYYDVLQVNQNADTDTIRKVFRYLAKKCHPDSSGGGNPELFRQIVKAHNILINPEKRAAYDIRYQEYWDRKWNIVREAANGTTTRNNREIRDRLLTLLYVQRRTDMNHPGLGDMALSRMLNLPMEFLEFDLWYLRQKGLLERLETGLLAISVDGVDYLESSSLHPSENRLLEANNPPQEDTAEDMAEFSIRELPESVHGSREPSQRRL